MSKGRRTFLGGFVDYRNIDTDYTLYFHVGRYYKKEINIIQLKYVLNDKGYSEKEIDSAISDYYYAYLHIFYLLNTFLIPLFSLSLLIYIFFSFFY